MARVFSGTTRSTCTARTVRIAHPGRAPLAPRLSRPAHLVRGRRGSGALATALGALARGSACLEMLGCGVVLALAATLALGAPASSAATAREAAHDALPAGTIGVGVQRSAPQQAAGGYVSAKLGAADAGALESEGSERPALTGAWYTTMASAYSVACNDGGTATASGVPLDDVTPTVASPWLPLGMLVEVWYGDACVVATVTDRGPYVSGRELDLAPATYRALGADTTDAWGVRCVSYRVVG